MNYRPTHPMCEVEFLLPKQEKRSTLVPSLIIQYTCQYTVLSRVFLDKTGKTTLNPWPLQTGEAIHTYTRTPNLLLNLKLLHFYFTRHIGIRPPLSSSHSQFSFVFNWLKISQKYLDNQHILLKSDIRIWGFYPLSHSIPRSAFCALVQETPRLFFQYRSYEDGANLPSSRASSS